jgi:hypothetical protein
MYRGFALFLVGAVSGFVQFSALLALQKRPLPRYRSLKSTKVTAAPLTAGCKISRCLIPGSSNSSDTGDTGGREITFLGGIFGASFLIKQN